MKNNADGIIIFHPEIAADHSDYNAKGLDNLHAAENKHFWFIARKEFIKKQLEKFVDKSAKMIEIGSGTGNVARFLKASGYKNISVGEMHMNGLKYARDYGIENCYQFDLLRTPFENEFDAVCMFDVLEHIDNEELALKNSNQMLKPGGFLCLTVPAHKWLWNRDDAIAAHKRRYTKGQLINGLRKNGFEIVTIKYFFKLLMPLLILRRFFNPDAGGAVKAEEYNVDLRISEPLNSILLIICRFENKVSWLFPDFSGGSLFVIGRKK